MARQPYFRVSYYASPGNLRWMLGQISRHKNTPVALIRHLDQDGGRDHAIWRGGEESVHRSVPNMEKIVGRIKIIEERNGFSEKFLGGKNE